MACRHSRPGLLQPPGIVLPRWFPCIFEGFGLAQTWWVIPQTPWLLQWVWMCGRRNLGTERSQTVRFVFCKLGCMDLVQGFFMLTCQVLFLFRLWHLSLWKNIHVVLHFWKSPHINMVPFAKMPGNKTLVKYPTPNFLSFWKWPFQPAVSLLQTDLLTLSHRLITSLKKTHTSSKKKQIHELESRKKREKLQVTKVEKTKTLHLGKVRKLQLKW